MDFSSCATRDGLKSTGVCGVNTLVSVGFDADAPIVWCCFICGNELCNWEEY